MINFALAIKGITFAIFIAEKDGITKLSLRSKGDIDVSGAYVKNYLPHFPLNQNL